MKGGASLAGAATRKLPDGRVESRGGFEIVAVHRAESKI